MAALVIAEHDNGSLKASTAHTITAAARCSDEIHVLIAGQACDAAAAAAAQLAGVSKVLVAEGGQFANGLAENVAEQALALAAVFKTERKKGRPHAHVLEGQHIALLFEKPSLRTHSAFGRSA